MEKNYARNLITILIIEGVLFFLIYIGKYDIPCFFEEILHIPCLGCNMTAAFDSLLQLDIIGFLTKNTFSLFALFLIIIFNVTIIYDLIMKKSQTKKVVKTITNHIGISLFVIFTTWGINIVLYLNR